MARSEEMHPPPQPHVSPGSGGGEGARTFTLMSLPTGSQSPDLLRKTES
jgi:hypothetical protein